MNKKRNIGLDIIRITATIMVLVCHSGFFSLGLNPKIVVFSGVISVEVFFTLSGFLAGRSIFLLIQNPSPTKGIKMFYLRRCIRVLPLYYLTVILTSIMSGNRIPLSIFLFAQNFRAVDLGFMPVSWTLAIEMWFFLIIPPAFIWLVKKLESGLGCKRSIFTAILILCMIPFIIRVVYVLKYQPTWDYGVRKQVFLRLDSIMLGVFTAAMREYAREWYDKLLANRNAFLLSVSGLVGSYLYYANYLCVGENFNTSSISKILIFTIIPICSCGVIAYLENIEILEEIQNSMVGKLICNISSITYGIYLLHWSIFEAISRYFMGARFAVSWMGYLGSIVLTIIAAKLADMLIDAPIRRNRDKILAKI